MANRIRTGDIVAVIAGSDAGATVAQPHTGRVLRIIRDKSGSGNDRVVVEGINRAWKHVRPNQRNPQGGRIQKDAPIHISNVMLIDPSTGKPSRVRFNEVNGEKHRVAKRNGTDMGSVRKR